MTPTPINLVALAPPPAPPPPRSRQPTTEILLLAGLLIAAAVALGLLALAFRRRLLSRDHGPGHASLADSLRDMHARGILSNEEYERVRRSIARSAARSARPDPPKSG